MKQYHTSIIINGSLEEVWHELTNFKDYPEWNPIVGKLEGKMEVGSKISTYIVPLKNTYSPILTRYEVNKEIAWRGVQGASFFLAADHYYRLKIISETQVEFLHGEFFTGLFSYFLSARFLGEMLNSFEQHNIILKQRIEKPNK